jgi:hypothetical protein
MNDPVPGLVHDFHERLAYSEAGSHEPFWDAVYRKAFPNLVSHTPCPGDFASQRMGIDRVIVLSSGDILKIDEKKRERQYEDVLLEYLANDMSGAPGWIEKDLAIDYLAYAFMPTRKCLLLPWLTLRRVWAGYGKRWLNTHPIIKAQNKNYKTLSVAVPIAELQSAVSKAMLVTL